ncbi:MAG: tRNA dihydrouridine(20/20a) synthase DusA [Deinococcales bacterium]
MSVAPMMDRTDRHFRYLLRGITAHTLLYTEMVTARAVLHGDRERLIGFHPDERPLALQLAGDDPAALAQAASIAEERGYDEVNLNVGCPSPRVSSANFGACLMARPDDVAKLVAAMREAVRLPVTVKHRIGIDALDRYQDLERFVTTVATAGADAFAVHARKAWLTGLSPRQNREVPPLRHADVYRLKRTLPALTIELNGGVNDLDDAARHLERVDGVMIGRAVYDDPMVLAGADGRFHAGTPGGLPVVSRRAVVEHMLPYIEASLEKGASLHALTRHLLALFRGVPGGKRWRRHLSEGAVRPGTGPELVAEALTLVDADALERRAPRAAHAA